MTAAAKAKTGGHWRRIFALTVFGALMLAALALANSGRAAIETPPPPSVWSDKADYAPGEQVNLSGANWAPGESVHIRVNDDAGETWRRDVDVTADESGAISDQFNLPDWFVAQYSVTATGASSGTVTWTFTDGNAAFVSGTVTDSVSLSAISGATVTCTSGCNNSPAASTSTNASGSYVFDNTTTKLSFAGNGPTNLTLTVSKTGYTSGTITLSNVRNGDTLTGKNVALTPSDATPPSVLSINRVAASPTNTSSNVSWAVTFSESVTGVDSTDFTLANTGLGGTPAISTVSGSGASYTVTASSGTGSGTLGLNLNDNDSIQDGAANKLGGNGTGTADGGGAGNGSFAGQAYTIDRSAPTVTASAVKGDSPSFSGATAYTAGDWTNKDVRVTFTCADTGGSSLTAGSGNQTQDFTAETGGATATFSGTCADNAGNTASGGTFGLIKVDKTAPSVAQESSSPAANGAGWNNSNITVVFKASDALSGLNTACQSAFPDPIVGGRTQDQLITTEGNPVTVDSDSCTDVAGNTGGPTTSSNFKLDKTNPGISFVGESPAKNADGWNNSNVTLSWSCTDSLSTPVNGTETQLISSEGSNQQATGTCHDKAGNSASSTDGNVNVDKTPPTVTVTGVSNGATYTLGSVPAAGCSTSDALSGVKSSATLSSSGGPVGSITASCNGAEDKAGNTNSASVTYTVNYNFSGFFAPVDNNDICNVVKAGSAVPIKFSLHGYQGMNIFAAGYPKVSAGTCSGAPLDTVEETVTAGGSILNYDSTSDQYIYVWKTDKAWAGKAMRFTIVFADGTTQYARFSFSR